MSEKEERKEGGEGQQTLQGLPAASLGAPSTTGRLKVSLVRRPTAAPVLAGVGGNQASGEAKREEGEEGGNSFASNEDHSASKGANQANSNEKVKIKGVEVEEEEKVEEEKAEEMKWKARSLVQQLLAPRAPAYDFLPAAASRTGHATIVIHGSETLSTYKPETAQEAMLMVAALRALGKPSAANLLIPSDIIRPINDAQSSHLSKERQDRQEEGEGEGEGEGKAKNVLQTTISLQTDPIASLADPFLSPVTLTPEEVRIAKSAAKSAQMAAANHSKKYEEDDESLALELELEFTQLDPITRVELLKQLDLAEQEQFGASGARAERLWRATREASFHNIQLAADRSRIGPFYFDPHTRSSQTYHSIAIAAPVCEARQVEEDNNNHNNNNNNKDATLTVINPLLPLPRGFSYFQHTTADFNPSIIQKLVHNEHVNHQPNPNASFVPPVDSSNLQDHSKSNSHLHQHLHHMPSHISHPSVSSSRPSKLVVRAKPVVDEEPTVPAASPSQSHAAASQRSASPRYAVLDGYVQWLRTEVENHRAAAAPLDPYAAWSRQFTHQWDAIQSQGCFDFIQAEGASSKAHMGATTLLSSVPASLAHSTSINASKGPASSASKVPAAVRNVWKEHRKHLEAEEAVQLAMEGAERARRRARFGDPEDQDIDPGKPLTRDERRKLQKREKEYAKLIELFLAQGLVEPDSFPLQLLSWYDMQTLFSSLGISVTHLLEEEAAKNQLPALIIGPNGQVRARSHKKGAAKAARLAAKKAAAAAVAAGASPNGDPSSSLSSSLPLSALAAFSSISSPPSKKNAKKKKRSRADDETEEKERFAHSAHSHFQSQLASVAPTTISLLHDPSSNLQHQHQCQGCGAMDDSAELVLCSFCSRSWFHTYCIDDQASNFDTQHFRCPNC